jgi:oxygen-dependent protoporphyrinogen oxidase
MGELVDTLAARLPAGAVRLSCPAAAVVRGGGGDAPWQVRLGDGRALAADGVVLAGEAPRMAPLVRELHAGLAQGLGSIGYASSVTVTLAYPRAAIGHPLDGFGFVVPRGEARPILACTFSSVKYPGRAPDGDVLLRAFLGGARGAGILDHDDATLIGLVEADLGALLGIRGAPTLTRVARHPEAMPQYEVGHLARVAALEAHLAALPGLALAGAGYRGVGIADCVRSGEAAAERLLATLTLSRAEAGAGAPRA